MRISASNNSSTESYATGQIQEFQRLVMKLDSSAVTDLLALLQEKDILIIKQPETALVMICATDCFDTDFCLGEALVTEAVVEYNDKHGYAMVLGDDHTRALAIASLDAFFQGSDKEHQSQIEHFLASASEEIAEKDEKEKKLVASTRVNFENMVKG
jgi:phosphonate C-P lyase system protein PhnG